MPLLEEADSASIMPTCPSCILESIKTQLVHLAYWKALKHTRIGLF